MESPMSSRRKNCPGTEEEQQRAHLEQQVQHLMVAIEHLLRLRPDGFTELELIRDLQRPPWKLIGDVCFQDPARLYPVHFLVFHSLYRLRDQLAEHGEWLSISPLGIRLDTPSDGSGNTLPDEPDALRLFYLDLDQYRMSEDSIRRMMDAFWAGQACAPPAQAEVLAAARKLGLDELPEDFAPVKLAFRRAVMQAHPDRGGDTEAVQELNHAFSVLKSHFRYTR